MREEISKLQHVTEIINIVGIMSKTSMSCVAEISIEVSTLSTLAPIRFTLTSALCSQSEQSQLIQLLTVWFTEQTS